MDTSIPQNLSQCAFNFDDLNAQPLEPSALNIGLPVIQTPVQKRCTRCQKIKDLDRFHKDRSICKDCRKAYDREKYLRAKNAPVDESTIQDGCKCCVKCEKLLPATAEYWHVEISNKSGFRSRCKVCMNEYDKRYRRNSKFIERMKRYNKDHKDRITATARKYVQAHKEQYCDNVKRYNRTDRGKLSARANSHKRISRKKTVKGSYTPQQVQEQLKRQKHKCYYCQKKLQKTNGKCIFHIEHTFPLSRVAGTDIPANSIDYLVLACPACNMSKGDKFPWEFPEGGRLL